MLFLADPSPGVQSRAGAGDRFGTQNITGAQADAFSLTNDQVQMTVLRVLIADHFFIFMGEDLLFHRKHRRVTGDISPTIAPVPHIKRKLLQNELRPSLCDRNRKITLKLGRSHGLSRQLAKSLSPTV